MSLESNIKCECEQQTAPTSQALSFCCWWAWRGMRAWYSSSAFFFLALTSSTSFISFRDSSTFPSAPEWHRYYMCRHTLLSRLQVILCWMTQVYYIYIIECVFKHTAIDQMVWLWCTYLTYMYIHTHTHKLYTGQQIKIFHNTTQHILCVCYVHSWTSLKTLFVTLGSWKLPYSGKIWQGF